MPAPFEISFITQAFRDVADQDYVAARTLHRVGLDLQFLWSGLQAVEKYLKGILLFNGGSAKGLGHRLTRAYERVLAIPDISFDFPPDIGAFLERLEVYGQDRYLQHPFHTHGEELLELDRCVWYVRRYCQYLRGELERRDGQLIQLLDLQVRDLQAASVIAKPTRFRIIGGYLERVLDTKSALRASLVWNNEYYGAPRLRRLRSFKTRSVSINSVHFIEPSVFAVFRDRVDFPKAVVEYFEQQPNTALHPTPAASLSRRSRRG